MLQLLPSFNQHKNNFDITDLPKKIVPFTVKCIFLDIFNYLCRASSEVSPGPFMNWAAAAAAAAAACCCWLPGLELAPGRPGMRPAAAPAAPMAPVWDRKAAWAGWLRAMN